MCADRARCDARLAGIGAAKAAARELAGHDVKLVLFSDPFSGGVTLRWGVLGGSDADGVTVDGFHDSAGLYGQYPLYRPDGCRVPWTSIRRVERNWHQA